MNACARYAPMIGAREGELTAQERDALAAHLSACEACQARLADERALEGLLGEALLREASRRDFSAFADGVMERIEPHPSRARARRWRRRWALVLGSTLAPALAALGLIMYLRAQGPVPQAGDVEVTSEDHVPMVLQTSDGPLVILGDAEPEKT
jgi:anti-sigma factor RsiW